MNKTLVLLILSIPFLAKSQAGPDTLRNPLGQPLKVYHTSRLAGQKPQIDGSLNDSCWKTGGWSENFTQWTPLEGGRPSQPTRFKILYDDKNIYVAIRAFDSLPGKISRKASRRDDLAGDVVGIAFDTYQDRRTSLEFDLTAAGQKLDCINLHPFSYDVNWNVVWEARVGKEDSAWTAEFKIPLSQLRYSSKPEQTWGLHCWRFIDRYQEESDWEYQSRKSPGFMYMFGELRGISGLPKARRFEIMPFVLGKLNTYRKEPGNPFTGKGRTWFGNAGLDGKVGLSNNFTADFTVNPDFGQVESDPSVMNLSAFETFYEEKRPFFLEGNNILSFDLDGSSLFYSRRIGHSPSYSPSLAADEYMKSPGNTTILSAAKVTGKTPDGFSVGVLQSITAGEFAEVRSATGSRKERVEPLANYALARVQKNYNQGRTIIGGILTATNRSISSPQLSFLSRNAFSGGADFHHDWHDREFYIDGKLTGSNIRGSAEAIGQLQRSSACYYQRPDADYVNYDSSRTTLSGSGGYLKIGKGSKGLWRYAEELSWRSPGLDFNDIGYLSTADQVKQKTSLSYFIDKPTSIFRAFNFGLSQANYWNFGRQYLYSVSQANMGMGFLNKWGLSATLAYNSQKLDTRLLRGGPGMLVPGGWEGNLYLNTDYSKKLTDFIGSSFSSSGSSNSRNAWIMNELSLAPVKMLKLSLSASYSVNRDRLQYVDTKKSNTDYRYIFGTIDQHTLNTTLKVNYNMTPDLSIQYFGSAFSSVGRYNEFKAITDPMNREYDRRFCLLNPVANSNEYAVYEGQSTQPDYTFDNPDFNFIQFRSNLVLRWEYSAGSQFYVVWSQERTNSESPGIASAWNALGGLNDIYPNSVFLVKMNYWISR